MRHLVESLVYRDMVTYLLKKSGKEQNVITLKINPKNISELVGYKKSNIDFINSKFFIDKLEIIQDKSVESDTLVLNTGNKSIISSKNDYYSILPK